MCSSFILVCKMVALGQIESPTLSHIHCKMIIHQAVKILWCTCTPEIHTNAKLQKQKIFSWCQVRFVKNKRLERKTSGTRVYLTCYSKSHLRHTYRTYYKLFNLELFLTQLYDISFNGNHGDSIYIYIAPIF